LGGWEGRGGRVRRGSGPAGRYWAGGGAGGLSLPRVPHHLALGEAGSSPSASFLALGELIIFFSFFCSIFFCAAFQHYFKLPAQIWPNINFFKYISLDFHFIDFLSHFKIELQVH
jgi:hypothetical protein